MVVVPYVGAGRWLVAMVGGVVLMVDGSLTTVDESARLPGVSLTLFVPPMDNFD